MRIRAVDSFATAREYGSEVELIDLSLAMALLGAGRGEEAFHILQRVARSTNEEIGGRARTILESMVSRAPTDSR